MARGSTRARKQATADRPGVADPAAPLDGGELLTAARPVLSLLRTDLEERATDPGVTQALEARYEDEKKNKLTGDSFAAWREARIAQIAASWFLSCVFVRTLEDRGLLDQARLAGPGAIDSQAMFFQLAPSLTERDYLLFVFRELAELPASRALFDREHAPVWQLSPSAGAAKELLRLFRTPSAETPAFRFGQASTRFLGDLYQDLYEDVRKRFALLQTPDFVESFILDRTLEPAIARFGLDDTTLIDATCGSGHFLLGAFERLFEHRLRQTPAIDVKLAAQLALDAVFGADINPYAAAIARMRLVLAFLEKARIQKLKDAPAPKLHLVVADSLRYNPQHVQLAMEHHASQDAKAWVGDAFPLEDDNAARDVLLRQYAAVVGNPPYITEKDPTKRETYRVMYPRSAAGKYALSAPFCERFFQLARDRGYVGQITASSFMKREFGKALIEDYLPTVNLELIINTSGAYIPGHGTPTVLLFGTHEAPVAREVRAVLAKRGEPSTPAEPAKGEVWSSIAEHWNDSDFENDYISVASTARDKLAKHPWSMGGGGAVELKELLEERAQKRLNDLVDDIGFASFTGLDDAFIMPASATTTLGLESAVVRPIVVGEDVRDWTAEASQNSIAPYDQRSHEALPLVEHSAWARLLWRYRTVANNVTSFGGKTRQQCGENWWEWYRWQKERYAAPFRITFAEVATHNHFALDCGGKVFSRTAPIIKLPASATEDEHLALLAYLNSSTACFWMKQVAHKKSSASQKHHADPARAAYAFSGTSLRELPVPQLADANLVEFGRRISALAAQRGRWVSGLDLQTTLSALEDAERVRRSLQQGWSAYDRNTQQAAYLQEELDWYVYTLFDLAAEAPVFLDNADVDALGTRPFEAVTGYDAGLSDRVRSELTSTRTGLRAPEHWQRRRLDERVAIVESREFKRMWRDTELNVDQAEYRSTLGRRWLEQRLIEDVEGWLGHYSEVASLRRWESERGNATKGVADALGEEMPALARRLIENEAVPFLAAHRYTELGLTVSREWEAMWAAQRKEDRGEAVISAVPRRFEQAGFASARYWQLRGKLDVPKERFISYPGCESDQDGEPVYGWAGWNHLQRALALAALYQKRKTEEGWTADRLMPMLAGLLELLPWLQQWHNEVDLEYGQRMGDFFDQFLDGQCIELRLTRAQLEAWRPGKRTARSSVRRTSRRPEAAPHTSIDVQPQITQTTAEPRNAHPSRGSRLPRMPSVIPQMAPDQETALVIWALLHAAGGTLPRIELARAFALRTRPDLLTRFAPRSLTQAEKWATKIGTRSVAQGTFAATLRTLSERDGVILGIDTESRTTVSASASTPAEDQLDPWFRFEARLALEVLRAQPANSFEEIDATLAGEDLGVLKHVGS